jgi:hypothetical protein
MTDDVTKTDRLLVDELDSVGLVVAGANPESHILITKSETTPPSTTPTESPTTTESSGRGGSEGGVNLVINNPAPETAGGIWQTVLAKLRRDETAGTVTPTEKARNLGEWIEARIHSDFTMTADGMFGDGHVSRDERIAMSSAIGEALTAFSSSLMAAAPHLFDRDPFDGPDTDTTTAQKKSPDTVEAESKTKEAHVPDITLSDEDREALDETTKSYVEHLEAELAKAGETPAEDPPDPVEKALEQLPPEVAEVLAKRDAERDAEIAKANEAAQEAIAKADALEDARLAKVYAAKAAELSEIGETDKLAPVLRKADTGQALTAEEAELLAATLKRANDLVATSEFYSEFGLEGGATPGSAMAVIHEKAKVIKAENPGMLIEQAEAQVMADEPDLAARADAEVRAKAGR